MSRLLKSRGKGGCRLRQDFERSKRDALDPVGGRAAARRLAGARTAASRTLRRGEIEAHRHPCPFSRPATSVSVSRAYARFGGRIRGGWSWFGSFDGQPCPWNAAALDGQSAQLHGHWT